MSVHFKAQQKSFYAEKLASLHCLNQELQFDVRFDCISTKNKHCGQLKVNNHADSNDNQISSTFLKPFKDHHS